MRSSQYGGNRWITNPRHMPIGYYGYNSPTSSTNLLLRYGTASQVYNANSPNFYTYLAYNGAQNSIITADTYVTLCDLTGAGFLTHVVAPTHTAAYTPSIKLTIDGVVYTFTPSAAQSALGRMLIGCSIPTSTDATTPVGLGSGISTSFAGGAKVGGLTQVMPAANLSYYQQILMEHEVLANNFPALRFESACKVEVKASLLSATAVDKQAAVQYRLDITS